MIPGCTLTVLWYSQPRKRWAGRGKSTVVFVWMILLVHGYKEGSARVHIFVFSARTEEGIPV
jgi:hypothetical protein